MPPIPSRPDLLELAAATMTARSVARVIVDIEQELADVLKERTSCVLALRAEGVTYARIGELLGVTEGRVRQIAVAATVTT